ncbi:MAG TPA: hypothetical protein VGC12_04685 [Methyloradius sp.]
MRNNYICPHCRTKYVLKPMVCNLCKQSTGILEHIRAVTNHTDSMEIPDPAPKVDAQSDSST